MEMLEYIKHEQILQKLTVAVCGYSPPGWAALGLQHQDPDVNTTLFLDFSVVTFNTEKYFHFPLLF
jgi:hypothetical protein